MNVYSPGFIWGALRLQQAAKLQRFSLHGDLSIVPADGFGTKEPAQILAWQPKFNRIGLFAMKLFRYFKLRAGTCIRAYSPSAECSPTHDHVQPHGTDFCRCTGVHDLLRQTDQLYRCLQADWHIHSVRDGLLPRFAVVSFWQRRTEPALQDPPLTTMASVTGRLPVLRSPLV